LVDSLDGRFPVCPVGLVIVIWADTSEMAAGDESVLSFSCKPWCCFAVAPVDGHCTAYGFAPRHTGDGTYLADWDIPIHLKPA